MHSEFYLDSTLSRLEDTLRKAVMKFGACNSIYVDYKESIIIPET
jgi:putative transposase